MARFTGTVLLIGLAVHAGCDRAGPVPVLAEPDAVFDCGSDLRFTVRTGSGEVTLGVPEVLGSRSVVLAATPAASGARYQTGDVVYWNQGEEALIEIDGRRFAGCRLNPAAAP